MLVDFLVVLPSYSALVLHAHPVLAPEALLVVGLGLVLLHLLDVIPSSCGLVLPVRLNAELASEANLVV